MNTYSEPDHLTGYCADARVAIVDNDERALESVVSLLLIAYLKRCYLVDD